MISKTRVFAALLAGSVMSGGVACRNDRDRVERWATTENTAVPIDWNKVNEAYKLAEGPEDLERRINEIYEGDEIISISVRDVDQKTQEVTGFFDKNASGAVDDGEKIFTIKRELTGEGTGQIQTVGYGPYYGYHSPMMGIASGMLLGAMMSHAFTPTYAPVYTRPYTTTAARASSIASHRSSYRQANPQRFSRPSRTTGRTWGGRSRGSRGTFRGGGFRGGGRFGLARAGRTVRPERLTA